MRGKEKRERGKEREREDTPQPQHERKREERERGDPPVEPLHVQTMFLHFSHTHLYYQGNILDHGEEGTLKQEL